MTTDSTDARIAAIAGGLSEAQRKNFLRDISYSDAKPPMWIRAMDHRLIDYHPNGIRGPWLSWTDLGLAVCAHLKANS